MFTKFQQSLRRRNAALEAKLVALAGHAKGYEPSKLEKRLMMLLVVSAVAHREAAYADTQAALRSVQTTVISIAQIVFAIVLIVGLVRTVIKFMNAAPDAMSSLAYLMGGVILWFGFQFFKDDLVTNVGGGNTGGGVR
jgi:hypothetical protein